MIELLAFTQSVFVAFAETPQALATPLTSATFGPVSHETTGRLFGLSYTNIIEGLVTAAIASAAVWGYARFKARVSKRRTKADSPYWIAAATVLRDSLYQEQPEAFRRKLSNKIVGHIARTTNVNKVLLRFARLIAEDRLLAAARPENVDDDAAMPGLFSVSHTFKKLEPTIDAVMRQVSAPDAVTFDNCFQLDALREGASQYFGALTALEDGSNASIPPGTLAIEGSDRFITPIAVTDGFVAPTFLVAGLLQQFDSNWQLALKHFSATLGGDPKQLILTQRFEFFCWLLWGPSIPACTCKRWRGSFTALQYGYGDENNSFPLLLEEEHVDAAYRKISSRLAEIAASGKGALPLAFGSKFSGVFAWGPRYRRDDVDYPRIYSVPTRPGTQEHALQIGGVTALNGLALLGTVEWMPAPRQYYSAYLWIMFQVCWDGEALPTARTADRWASLFPIFEHANLADGQTLSFLKERLAEKAIAAVRHFEDAANGALRLRYLCATDDPGDVTDVKDDAGAHRFRFRLDDADDKPLRNEVFAHGGQPNVATMTAAEKNRLRSVLYEKLAPSPEARTRMFEPAPPGTIITACDLPAIIQEFYERLPHLHDNVTQ